jgi:DNA-binding SARP family transcriptional activator
VDAYELLALGERASPQADRGAEIARLQAAAALHEGEFLPEWRYAEWAADLRRELAGVYERTLEALGAALVAAGRPREALAPLERLLARDPEREAACRSLMRAHEANGEPALALRRYHVLRAVLRRSGTEPGVETRALYTAILRRPDQPGRRPAPG